jgi:hypothetical protein
VEASFAEGFKTWAAIAADLGTVFALLAGAIWFFRTSKYQQRVQFDLECTAYNLIHNGATRVGEIRLVLENKGFIEHRIFHLTLSIHSLDSETELQVKPDTQELKFTRRVLPQTQIVPPAYGYYFVRPGVRQVITHIVTIPASASVIRVTAGFAYDRGLKYPHTVRRVFSLTARAQASVSE